MPIPHQTFHSKKDLLLGIIIWMPLIGILSVALVSPEPISLILIFLVIILIGWLWFSTKYIVQGNILKVNAGPIRFKNIDITTIRKIEKTNSLLSSPALSFDRIMICHNKYDEIIISPKDKKEFIATLQSINPGIVDQSIEEVFRNKRQT